MTFATASAIVISKWTLDEYHRMIDAGILCDRQVELLRGEIVEMAPEGEIHAHLSSDAADYCRGLLRGQAKIRESKPITLPNQSEPEPDIAIVQALGDRYLDHHPYPENIFWVVEYSDSSLAKDLEIKTKIYAQVGILEYWIINLQRMELVIFRYPGIDSYQEKRTLTAGEVSSLAFPAVTISVKRLLRR